MISINGHLSMIGRDPGMSERVSLDIITRDSRRLVTIHGLTIEEASALAPLLYEPVCITLGKTEGNR